MTAFEALDWSDTQKADHLIKLLIDDDYNLYGDIQRESLSFRHEGISRLFEQKMSIPEVALRSGHKTWEYLRRYTHLLHNEPPDLWSQCKRIENKYWAENELVNRQLLKASMSLSWDNV